MSWRTATKSRLERFCLMARKPEEKKPAGGLGAKLAVSGNQDELAAPRKARKAESPHCGDMGLASREQQFRPGSGGR